MRTIDKSIELNASPARVWEVLTTPGLIPRWAGAFSPGANAESDWKTGGEVLWKNRDGKVMMRGEILEARPSEVLKVEFRPEQNTHMPEFSNAFAENYSLSPTARGVRLSINAGPFNDEDYAQMAAPWDEALGIIREQVEEGVSDGAADRPHGAPPTV